MPTVPNAGKNSPLNCSLHICNTSPSTSRQHEHLGDVAARGLRNRRNEQSRRGQPRATRSDAHLSLGGTRERSSGALRGNVLTLNALTTGPVLARLATTQAKNQIQPTKERAMRCK